jgi:hypothetical protein
MIAEFLVMRVRVVMTRVMVVPRVMIVRVAVPRVMIVRVPFPRVILPVAVAVRVADTVCVVIVSARRSATLAIYPSGVTILVVLLLPDRHSVLHFVNDVAAGRESFSTMTCAYTDPDRHLADRQVSNPVYACRVFDTEPLDGFSDDAFALFDRKRLECFIFEVADGVTLVVVAYPTLERRIATRCRVVQPRSQRSFVYLLANKTEGRHVAADQPPATGGMNTTESPSARRCDHSPNSAFTATLSISGARENG